MNELQLSQIRFIVTDVPRTEFIPVIRQLNERLDTQDMMMNEILNALGSDLADHESRIVKLESAVF